MRDFLKESVKFREEIMKERLSEFMLFHPELTKEEAIKRLEEIDE